MKHACITVLSLTVPQHLWIEFEALFSIMRLHFEVGGGGGGGGRQWCIGITICRGALVQIYTRDVVFFVPRPKLCNKHPRRGYKSGIHAKTPPSITPQVLLVFTLGYFFFSSSFFFSFFHFLTLSLSYLRS